ncbi:MAG TPA: sulfotransferase domain-containing protein [Acidimicrobiia bacterium]|nr:sulfotransferase domain-containing protein [Acidimicrobiia bacterium]
MALPNFMLIGAGKAGSTSLWHYVVQHPDVFPPKQKEPSYFWTDKHSRPGKAETLEAYQSLFEGSESYKAVGDASPTYLVDENAPHEIRKMIPDVKLIAILRDPCARAFSEFMMHRMRQDEPERRFLDAVAADPSRPIDHRLNYIETGLYHKHLSRYLSVFPAGQLKVVLNDDLKGEPKEVMKDVFEFLGLDADVAIDTDVEFNVSGVPKIKALHWLLTKNHSIKRGLLPLLPKGLIKSLRRAKNANLERQFMTPQERAALLPSFEADILELEKLLGRDLSHWRTV